MVLSHVKLPLEDSSSVAGLRDQFFLILTVILGSGMPLGILFWEYAVQDFWLQHYFKPKYVIFHTLFNADPKNSTFLKAK